MAGGFGWRRRVAGDHQRVPARRAVSREDERARVPAGRRPRRVVVEELGRDEGGLGESRAECVEAGVAVVQAEAGGEGLEELVGRAWRAERDRGRSAGREGDGYGDGELGADAERHARNLDGERAPRKGLNGRLSQR